VPELCCRAIANGDGSASSEKLLFRLSVVEEVMTMVWWGVSIGAIDIGGARPR
jgi:hypothetical protein